MPEGPVDLLSPSPSAPAPAPTDGRRARGRLTRARVAEALVDLLEEGALDPTSKQVAARAGVSPRLVFHHFDDMEDLYLEVCRLQYERHWQHRPAVPRDLPVDQRIERVVAARSALYERVGAVRRAGVRRAEGSAHIALVLVRSNEQLRDELHALFADVLGRRPAAEADEALAALDAAASWEAWERLRQAQRLTRTAARRVMGRTLRALLAT